MLHPAPDAASLASVIEDLPAAERPLVIAGKALPAASPLVRGLVERCWDFAALSAAYRDFLATFAGLRRTLAAGSRPAPLAALLARVVLIHDYRRIILRDPMLPAALLPREWIGREAYATARVTYRQLSGRAESWVDAHLHDEKGPLPLPDPSFHRRFP